MITLMKLNWINISWEYIIVKEMDAHRRMNKVLAEFLQALYIVSSYFQLNQNLVVEKSRQIRKNNG